MGTTSYYLAQILHESDGLTRTIESSYKEHWNGSLEAFVDSDGRDCGSYLEAVENIKERDHFNNEYNPSKGKYKAAFRGRGLIQLTGCANYTNYFYHRLALKASLRGVEEDAALGHNLREIVLDGDERKRISYNMRIRRTMFCSEDDLDSLAGEIREDFLLEPTTFASNFEHTVNTLALPCPGGGTSTSIISENNAQGVRVEALSSIGSREFLVDSSLWFWKRHCVNNDTYEDELQKAFAATGRDGDEEIEGIRASSQCVRGYSPIYKAFDENSCEGPLGKKSIATNTGLLDSFCARLHYFRLLEGCRKNT